MLCIIGDIKGDIVWLSCVSEEKCEKKNSGYKFVSCNKNFLDNFNARATILLKRYTNPEDILYSR